VVNKESPNLSVTNQGLPPSSFSSAKPPPKQLDPSTAANLKSTQRLVATPQQHDRAILVRMDSVSAGMVSRLGPAVFGFGRHPDNQGLLDDDGISRFHARISVRGGNRYWLEDLDSSNGTFVNGRRISSCELCNGDTLQLGPRVSFRFSLASADEERVLMQLYESSVRDPLTQAYNRQYFSSRIQGELAYSIRHETDLSLLLLDIDFFKKINDSHGHLAGDAVLKEVARRMREQLRSEDVLARYGGEEFVIVLRNIPLDGAALAGERLRRNVSTKPVTFEGIEIPVTISIGVASLDCCETASANDLVAVADRRLYKAKDEGRNRVVVAD
jgi:diguanylate cyclase (GGDEF)-like protein